METNNSTPTAGNTAYKVINNIIGANTTHTSEDLNRVSTGDLPWARVLMPPTSSMGVGTNRHNLQPEDLVFGYFLDDDMQQPMVVGVLISGTSNGMAGSPSFDGTGSGSGSGSSDMTPGSGTGTGNITPAQAGGDNAEKAYFLIIKGGYTPANAAGIVGNLMAESNSGGDISPTIVEGGPKKGRRGYGIAQWTTKSRYDGLIKFAGNKYNTIEGQVAYLMHELKTTEPRAERALRNSGNDLEGSVRAFLEFERPHGYDPKLARATGFGFPRTNHHVTKRLQYAQAFYQKMQGKTQGPPAPATGSGTNVS